MRFFAYVPEAFASIWRNKTRSLLSALGMIIGISAVIGVLGLSQAASNGLKEQLSKGGDPGYFVMPSESAADPALSTLYYRDAALLQTRSGGVIGRAYPMDRGRNIRVKKGAVAVSEQRSFGIVIGGDANPKNANSKGKPSETISVSSTYPMNASMGLKLLSGRYITADDIDAGAMVGVMSLEAANKFFPHGALGQQVNLGPFRVTVIGVVKIEAGLFTSLVGETIWVPYTAMHRIAPGPIDTILFWPADTSMSSVQVIDAAKKALATIHRGGEYQINSQAAITGIFGTILNAVGTGLTFVGGIALLVAGIGIMNIMLVSVSERTREIGIRKSIGASTGDIGTQFLIEAILLSLGGGAIGTAVGIAIVLSARGAITNAVGDAPIPWALVIGIAVGFSSAIGVGFGFYPASRAARMDPVEALRS